MGLMVKQPYGNLKRRIYVRVVAPVEYSLVAANVVLAWRTRVRMPSWAFFVTAR